LSSVPFTGTVLRPRPPSSPQKAIASR